MAATLQKQEAQLAAIKTLGREWHVHKIMLCAQSPFFTKACEGRFREATENVITLRDDDPDVVAAMLGYLYTFEYADSHDLTFNVHVHIIADKYDLPTLAKIATTKFAAAAKTAWSSPSFAEAAALIFTDSTAISKELREGVIATASTHARSLKLDPAGASFRDVVSATPALAMAFWCAQDSGVGAEASNPPGLLFACPYSCGHMLSPAQLTGLYIKCSLCSLSASRNRWELNTV
ncbi:hypothetical protein LTR27_002039 [Elasticomyces elasticus]|nr:hypothetical protein LTR27_002039 [Elasticomyces elasticus]